MMENVSEVLKNAGAEDVEVNIVPALAWTTDCITEESRAFCEGQDFTEAIAEEAPEIAAIVEAQAGAIYHNREVLHTFLEKRKPEFKGE